MVESPIPADMPRISASLVVVGLDRAMDWYRDTLGLRETMRLKGPDGRAIHGELRAGDSVVMCGEQTESYGAFAPPHYGGSPASLMIYVEDADAAMQRAVQAGAKVKMPAADMFWGDRMGSVIDPFGHTWMIGHRVETLDEAEIVKRMAHPS